MMTQASHNKKVHSTYQRILLLFFFFGLTFTSPLQVLAQDGCTQATIGRSVLGTLGSATIGTNPIAAQTQTAAAIQATICQPLPRIKIPGLEFTSAETLAENIYTDADGSTYLFIPFLGEYISAVYRYGIAAAGVFVVLILIVSGIQWIFGGASPDNVDAAKERIKHAMTGLFIIATTYTFLYIINPELTSFKSLKIELVHGDSSVVPENHEIEGSGYLPDGSHPMRPGLPIVGPPTDLSPKDQCMYDEFLAGKNIGDRPETERIENAFGIPGVNFNVNAVSAQAWRNAITEVQNSTDPKVQGFVAWMRDYKARTVPDLQGIFNGEGVASTLVRNIGYNKNDVAVERFSYSMHVIGLAVDFMTRSNWDVYAASRYSSSMGTPAREHCTRLKNRYESTPEISELFINPEYQLQDIPMKIDGCINEVLPWSSIPDEFVRIFKSHGFTWGGDGWNHPGDRSDSMHFEYYGRCKDL